MDYVTRNKYEIFFNDGKYLASTGSSDSIRKQTIQEEMNWISAHIQKDIRENGKTIDDVTYVNISISFSKKNEKNSE